MWLDICIIGLSTAENICWKPLVGQDTPHSARITQHLILNLESAQSGSYNERYLMKNFNKWLQLDPLAVEQVQVCTGVAQL